MKTRLILCLVVATLPACNLMEGIHQFNPNYKRPVPFSSNWFDRLKSSSR